MTEVEMSGSSDCPICGKWTPHTHDSATIAAHRVKQKTMAVYADEYAIYKRAWAQAMKDNSLPSIPDDQLFEGWLLARKFSAVATAGDGVTDGQTSTALWYLDEAISEHNQKKAGMRVSWEGYGRQDRLDVMRNVLLSINASPSAPRVGVPEGWKLVPVEPTPAMSAVGFCVAEAEHDPAGVYRAMLAAAPESGGV